jgi:hypothetical protein
MLADSVLGCLQINKCIRWLEYEEIRRLLQSSVDCY